MSSFTQVQEKTRSEVQLDKYEISEEFSYGDLFLLVEGTIFVVLRRNLIRDSEFFRGMFELPTEAPADGASIEHPLRIDQVKKDDMLLFLRAVYPQHAFQSDEMTDDQFITVLHLLTMWNFTAGRKAILKRLKDHSDPVARVVVFAHYRDTVDVTAAGWLIPAVTALAQRANSLSVEEGIRLGPENTVKIACVREDWQLQCRCPNRCRDIKKCSNRWGGTTQIEYLINREFNVNVKRREYI